MAIDTAFARRTIVEAEFRALQAICQSATPGSVRDRALTLLSDYPFRDPLHQLVFEILRELRSQAPDELRALLPQRLTLKGFPDVDTEPFFQRHAMSAELAGAIVDYLRATAALNLTPPHPRRA